MEALTEAPGVRITRGDNVIAGDAWTPVPIHVHLVSSSGTVRSAVTVQSDGIFWNATLVDRQGRATHPEPGETLTVSNEPDAHLAIPDAAIHGDASKDRISGRCMPSSRYDIRLIVGRRLMTLPGRTNSVGASRQSLKTDLKVGAELTLECFYPTGDVYTVTNIAH